MARTKAAIDQDIHAALQKLKNEANEKEIELIELVSTIYEKVKEKQDIAIEKIEDAASKVNTSVHMHPWRFIGGAALGGLLAGLFLRR